ncbi:DUF2793 domain-containing protein [Parerythrobacter aestuarii]|uniref:DUF2793 domain-containing protein n=1 Tax=Parerythrobacter aestuarii TaxID=3020909 RepID=UPI0024DEE9DB|nr:DUF2793 domain-containing protein [Parerythrobacter aestuarii]
MADPVTYQSNSPRHALPLLFAAQAQKEPIVNEALGRLDALLHLAVSGQSNDPPQSPVEGECWLVGSSPTGSWQGQAERIAAWFANDWLFLEPRDGMLCWNADTSQFHFHASGWNVPVRPGAPAGGATIDAEARLAIDEIIAALTAAGVVGP